MCVAQFSSRSGNHLLIITTQLNSVETTEALDKEMFWTSYKADNVRKKLA